MLEYEHMLLAPSWFEPRQLSSPTEGVEIGTILN